MQALLSSFARRRTTSCCPHRPSGTVDIDHCSPAARHSPATRTVSMNSRIAITGNYDIRSVPCVVVHEDSRNLRREDGKLQGNGRQQRQDSAKIHSGRKNTGITPPFCAAPTRSRLAGPAHVGIMNAPTRTEGMSTSEELVYIMLTSAVQNEYQSKPRFPINRPNQYNKTTKHCFINHPRLSPTNTTQTLENYT